MTENRVNILEYLLKKGEPWREASITAALRLNTMTCRSNLVALTNSGYLQETSREGHRRDTPVFYYDVTPAGLQALRAHRAARAVS